MVDELFMGVNRERLEEFLVLIRDKNDLVSKANYFLERRAKVAGINVAIANQRDILSHLVSFLKSNDSTNQQKQLANAEEHLRRAIVESYQLAATTILKKLESTIDDYQEHVLVLRDNGISDAFSLQDVREQRGLIDKLFIDGRSVKSLNIWNPVFEEGVKKLIQSFDMAEELNQQLRMWIYKARDIAKEREAERRGEKWQRTQIVMAIAIAIVSLVAGALITRLVGG